MENILKVKEILKKASVPVDIQGHGKHLAIFESDFERAAIEIVKNIKVIQYCEGETYQLYCYTCEKWTEHNLKSKEDCKCLKCDTNKAR